jgi:hypothetical protein
MLFALVFMYSIVSPEQVRPVLDWRAASRTVIGRPRDIDRDTYSPVCVEGESCEVRLYGQI